MPLLFIFDMDDVLYHYDYRVRMAALTDLTGHDFDELRRRWWHEHGELRAEAGGFESAEHYLNAFEAAMGCTVPEAEWLRIRASAMTPWHDSHAAVRRAAELGQVTLLTNNGALVSKNLARLAPELVEIFGDHLFTSSDYGARKPDPLVFRRVLERYGADPRQAFFADDLPENIAGAESIGITGYRFEHASGLLAAIEAFAAARLGAAR